MNTFIVKIFALLASMTSVLCIVAFSQTTPPRFLLATGDITSPVEVTTNKTGSVELRFRLSDTKNDGLLKFARKYSSAPDEEILVGTNALMKPGMDSKISISNAVIRVSYAASESDYARAVATSLTKK
jgi:hypothetical protein